MAAAAAAAAEQPQAVPSWVVGSLPEGFLERAVAPQEAKWAGRPPIGASQSVRQPGAAEEELMALAPLRATLAAVPRSRMVEYRLATMSAEEALREQAAMREAQSPSRWAGGTALGFTRANLPLHGGRESDPRWAAGTSEGTRDPGPPARPGGAPGRARPKPKRKTAEQVALGFARPDEQPLQKSVMGGRTLVSDSVENHVRVLPEARVDGSEISLSDPRPFTDTESEEEKRARTLRASSRTWLRTDEPKGPPVVTSAAVEPPETAEKRAWAREAGERQEQEVAARSAAVGGLLRLLGVHETAEPKDPMNDACRFAQRVEANVERSFNEGTLYEGRRADKATLWRVLRDYLLETNVEANEEDKRQGRISPVDVRRGFVQLGLVPTDDVFAQLITLCRRIDDPDFDPVTSDKVSVWL